MLSKKQRMIANIFLLKGNDISGKKFLKFILSEYYGIYEFNYYYNKFGKPYINNLIFFNYSTTKDYIVLVVSTDEVGIDIELCSRLFPNNLINYIYNESDNYQKDNYNLLKKWVEKESYLKYLGTGINKKMSDVIIDNDINKLFYTDGKILLNCFSNRKINKKIVCYKINDNSDFIIDDTVNI